MGRQRVDVVVEATEKRAFASALGWPGWCRPGRTEEDAVEALLAYRDRYAVVAARAGLVLPEDVDLHVVERAPGTTTTTFGAPDVRSSREDGQVPSQELALLAASWEVLALRGEAGDRYWVRRAAWHVLDHAWEIEDTSV